ncbi:winged helix DNA-binding domain-containing protein [Actinomadura parmotrematis]|uniref:Winged helix DNA-binding domain-containing protein n=1 Tax=Actinomadura parmotrematis TaxID=2864039 RepID=A0ABS7FYH9_9ACTN|nr:winged helix DNA-binding domain-containing protein [Actinomadura parmotrematis]MBW8485371.1 winged helix DNA-binding domain-containing protein [Actinomadura parmotrematis]
MTADVLDRRALNRALLARQMLLERRALPALDAVERLAGMQSQAPNPPYVGLWTRLAGFDFAELAELLTSRRAVRVLLMRGTIHLVSARDAVLLRPLVQPIMDRHVAAFRLPDLDAVLAHGAELLAAAPYSAKELRALLAEKWPDEDPETLARAVHYGLPLVQVPPRGVWGKGGLARHTVLGGWLADDPEALATEPDAEEMVLRYLAAFGPASVRDAQQWSGLTRLNAVFERLAGRLVRFRDEEGRVLYDLPDAPRPGGDVPAPVRLVPDFDNLTLSHADRARILSEPDRKRLFTVNGIIRAALLVDGFVHGQWKMEAARGKASVRIEPYRPLPAGVAAEAEDEARRLLAAAHPEAVHSVEIADV